MIGSLRRLPFLGINGIAPDRSFRPGKGLYLIDSRFPGKRVRVWSPMLTNWKHEIIHLTEFPEARQQKIDASFFPALTEERVLAWETENGVTLSAEIRSFLLQSDGLEVSRGEFWPILPLASWEVLRDECSTATPWIRFGESDHYRYLLSTGHSPSIYRHETFGSEEEFFSSSIRGYLTKVFRNET